nr:PE family protein [Mycobacterium tuberculosis]
MSFVLVSPETVAAVATDLKRIGASLAHENASAAAAPAPTAAKLTAAQSASSHPTTLGGYPWPVGSTGWRWPSDR